MSFNWNNMQASSDTRRQILEAEAAQSHLAYIARSGRKRTVRIYGPAMFRVGGWLMAWGRQLQAQYVSSIPEMHEATVLFAKTSMK